MLFLKHDASEGDVAVAVESFNSHFLLVGKADSSYGIMWITGIVLERLAQNGNNVCNHFGFGRAYHYILFACMPDSYVQWFGGIAPFVRLVVHHNAPVHKWIEGYIVQQFLRLFRGVEDKDDFNAVALEEFSVFRKYPPELFHLFIKRNDHT